MLKYSLASSNMLISSSLMGSSSLSFSFSLSCSSSHPSSQVCTLVALAMMHDGVLKTEGFSCMAMLACPFFSLSSSSLSSSSSLDEASLS
jgi:hypothetical protein